MDDDLGVPQAIAVLHETVRRGNTAIDEGAHDDAWAAFVGVDAMVRVLGFDELMSAGETSRNTGLWTLSSRR